jgi:hypothetical protein
MKRGNTNEKGGGGYEASTLRDFRLSAAKQVGNALIWVISQRVVVISYRRFDTTHGSLLMKKGPMGWFETSVKYYHNLLRSNPG